MTSPTLRARLLAAAIEPPPRDTGTRDTLTIVALGALLVAAGLWGSM